MLLLTALSAITEITTASLGTKVEVRTSGIAMLTLVEYVATIVVVILGRFGAVSTPVDSPVGVLFPDHELELAKKNTTCLEAKYSSVIASSKT